MRRLTGGVGLMLTLALGSAGCDNSISTPTPTTPVSLITESSTGSITPAGAVSYFYNTAAAGPLTATILTLAPDPTISLGLAIGTFNFATSTCQTTIANDRAGQGTTVSGNVSGAGGICVRIYDANGTIPASSKFELVVVHP